MGSSRDWAAKGTYLLGVKAVLATSYERIHRSNLIGMGVLPLQYEDGEDAESLGLDGTETFDLHVDEQVGPRGTVPVTATRADGSRITFDVVSRLDSPVEIDYYKNGGILHTVLRRLHEEARAQQA
jgi:Aconitase A